MDLKHHFHTQQMNQDDVNDRLMTLYTSLVHDDSKLEQIRSAFAIESPSDRKNKSMHETLKILKWNLEQTRGIQLVNAETFDQTLEVVKDIVSVPSVLTQLI